MENTIKKESAVERARKKSGLTPETEEKFLESLGFSKKEEIKTPEEKMDEFFQKAKDPHYVEAYLQALRAKLNAKNNPTPKSL